MDLGSGFIRVGENKKRNHTEHKPWQKFRRSIILQVCEFLCVFGWFGDSIRSNTGLKLFSFSLCFKVEVGGRAGCGMSQGEDLTESAAGKGTESTNGQVRNQGSPGLASAFYSTGTKKGKGKDAPCSGNIPTQSSSLP